MRTIPTSVDRAVPSMRWTSSADEMLRFERLVSELSASFINMPASNIDAAMLDALRRIVELLAIDRSTLSTVVRDSDVLETLHSWAIDGVASIAKGMIRRPLPWVLAMARAGRPIVFSRLDELPPQASEARDWYAHVGLKSHVGIPVVVGGELLAVLGFGTLHHERQWSSELVERLQLVADMFGGALARKRAHDDVERALGFERLLVDISASLVTQVTADPNVAVRRALHSIGEFLEVDRAALWALAGDGGRFEVTHTWVSEGAVEAPAVVDQSLLPTIFRSVAGGSVVSLSSVEDLAGASADELRTLHAAGVRSLLAVPLVAEGFVVGALSMSALRDTHLWPRELIPRVRLVGEVFVSVLTRRRAAVEIHKAQSETAQYRERLAHLVRVHTVGEMSAAIAHEVNQPLMAIENYAHAATRRLGQTEPDAAKLLELLGKIGVQAARAGDVLKRLRAILKKHESEATSFDMGALVVDTINLVEMESRLMDVRVEVVVAPDLPRVFADEVQIQQVVLNLARNGIEAMHDVPQPEKVLKVEARATATGELVVRVLDRGRGLSAEDAEHLFEPFYSTKKQGLGIGLAICRSIIEAHGGELGYARELGEGTAFYFTLPMTPT